MQLLASPLLAILLAAEPAAPVPNFTLATAEGKALSGPLFQVDEGWAITLDGKPPIRTAGADVISLRRSDLPLPRPPSGARVIFANGDCLPGDARDLVGERLTFRASLDDPEFGTARPVLMVLPLPTLAVLWLTAPTGDLQADRLPRFLLTQKRTRDVVRLRNGDTVEGTVSGLDKAGFHVEVNQKEVLIERKKVAYVAFNSELMRAPQTKVVYAHLVLANGARLALASGRTQGRSLAAKTLTGSALQVPLDQIVSLDLRQGRAVYLSDLKPSGYQESPWTASLTWPWVADGNVHRRSLHLAGGCYDKGLGMHTASRITYTLAGKYQRFESLVGLDDRDGREGIVRVKILVDGKPRDFGWDKDLTARDGPKPVRIDVKGARELTLVVERGRGGLAERQGCVDWVDARLVR